MAKWELITKTASPTGSYIGWKRKHTNIHMKKVPMSKTSIVQISSTGRTNTVLGETVAHSVFSKPGEKGLILYKRQTVYKSKESAATAAQKLKQTLAKRFDKVTPASLKF